jgi:hypothetical protein
MPLNLETRMLRSLSSVAVIAALGAADSGHGDAWSISISPPPLRSINAEVAAIAEDREMFEPVGLRSPENWHIFRELAYYMPELTLADDVLTDLWLRSATAPPIPLEYVEPASTLATITALAFVDRPAAIREAMCRWGAADPVEPPAATETLGRTADEPDPWAIPLARDEPAMFVPLLIDPSSQLPLASGLVVQAGAPGGGPLASTPALGLTRGLTPGLTRQAPLDLIIQWMAMGFAVLVFFVPALCAWASNHLGRHRSHPLDPGPSKGLLDGLARGVARTPLF